MLIFIWIPKTGGTSVYHALENKVNMQLCLNYGEFKNDRNVTFGHMCIKSLLHQQVISQDFYRQSERFTVVRNPYYRAISLWKYFLYTKKLTQDTTLKAFLSAVYMQELRPGLYNAYNYSQCSNQVEWIVPGTQILRFKNLKEEMRNKFGVSIEHLNKTPSDADDHMEYYTDETIKLVNNIYRKDFIMLDYPML